MSLTLNRFCRSPHLAALLLAAALALSAAFAAQAQPRPAGAAAPSVTDATAERTEASAYRLSWTVAPAETPVAVYVSGRPSAAPEQMQRLATGVQGSSYETTAVPDSIVRPYFLLQPEAGAGIRTATRVLPLDGGRNFRDLGGYPAAGGKRTKWGTIFRSGVLANLTDADYEYLSHLGIEVVCDFRSAEERTRETTNWRGDSTPQIISWGYASSSGGDGNEMAAFFEGGVTREKMRGMMTEMYGQIAYEHAEKYATMFRRLAAAETPLLFHCSAGKDRAGTGAALLLTALGVPRDVVVEDYAMSEKVVDYEAAFSEEMEAAEEEGGAWATLAKLPVEARAPLFRSDPAYIRSMFETVEEKHGSVEGFFHEVMGIEDKTLVQMRARLLE